MVRILYGVVFPEPILRLPKQIQYGIPNDKSWANWDGWSVQESGNRIYIVQEPIDLADTGNTSVPVAGKEEHSANAKEQGLLRLVYSVPTSMAVLCYVDVDEAKPSARAPSAPLLKMLAEAKVKPPQAAAPPPAAVYRGPPVTPMAAGPRPPGPTRPVVPPPSEIVLDDDEPEATAAPAS